MDTPATIALSRLVAQSRAMEVTADNLANATTPGYKTERLLFSDWLANAPARADDGRAISGGSTIAYTQDRATWRDQRDGALTHTANPLDLAISGDGWFTVMTARGPRLTRAGRFNLSSTGAVVDASGEGLLDTNGKPVQLSPADTRLTVAGDGTLSSENGPIAKIGVVRPANAELMTAEGGDLMQANTTTTTPVPQPKLVQGAVENSNVSPVIETTTMMTQLREFEFTTQFVQAESTREQNAIDKILTQN